jgi:hypothetical protein
VANAVGERGERHGEKRVEWARGKVAVTGTEAEVRGSEQV